MFAYHGLSILLFCVRVQAECKKVEADNGRLCDQVTQLKQRLVELEVRNGSKLRTRTLTHCLMSSQ